MTLNALNPLFQVLAALIIFVTGFFALFVSIVAAVMLARLGYVGALWALSKGATAYSERGQYLPVGSTSGKRTQMPPWRDGQADALTPRLTR